MILIFTTEAGDYSHLKIVDWLNHLKADFEIITGEGVLSGRDTLTIRNNEVFFNGINLTESVTAVFYRRWLTSSHITFVADNLLINPTGFALYKNISQSIHN